MEQIKAMLDEMSKDTGIGKEMQDLIENGNAAAIAAAAGKKGFTFTGEDWNEYLRWCEGIKGDGRKPAQGAELPPEELENVTGGSRGSGGGSGAVDDPYIVNCWFHAASEAENRNGRMRKRCNQFACKAWIALKTMPTWDQCGCWGTDKCVGSWHYAEGCPRE